MLPVGFRRRRTSVGPANTPFIVALIGHAKPQKEVMKANVSSFEEHHVKNIITYTFDRHARP